MILTRKAYFQVSFFNSTKNPWGMTLALFPPPQGNIAIAKHGQLACTAMITIQRTPTLILLDHRAWMQTCQFGRHVNVGYACDVTSKTDLPHISTAANNSLEEKMLVAVAWLPFHISRFSMLAVSLALICN